jgi:ABC-type hemin transport system substrate-binding protein
MITLLPVILAAFLTHPHFAAAHTYRIVSTSPQVTELLFQLDLGSSVVGTAQFSQFPEIARKIPEIGPLFNPGVERTLRLKPDWIVGDDETSNSIFLQAVEAFGIEHQEIKISSANLLFIAAGEILSRFGQNLNGNKNASLLKKCLSECRAQKRPPFNFIALAWLEPPIVFSDHTLLSDLIEATGGKNLFSGLQVKFPSVSHEWMMRQNVERIYVLSDALTSKTLSDLLSHWWPGKQISAISLDSNFFSRASFTPIQHMNALALPADPPLPRICGTGL